MFVLGSRGDFKTFGHGKLESPPEDDIVIRSVGIAFDEVNHKYHTCDHEEKKGKSTIRTYDLRARRKEEHGFPTVINGFIRHLSIDSRSNVMSGISNRQTFAQFDLNTGEFTDFGNLDFSSYGIVDSSNSESKNCFDQNTGTYFVQFTDKNNKSLNTLISVQTRNQNRANFIPLITNLDTMIFIN